MINHRVGVALFVVGVALMASAVMVGLSIEQEVENLGLQGYQTEHGMSGVLKFVLLAFGFPLGVGICLAGALCASERSRWRMALFSAFTVAGAATTLLVSILFGRHPQPAFFGTGGMLILVFLVLSAWYLAAYRAKLPAGMRGATDLQAAGYVCFAMAAWNLCGVGGMPSFLLDPGKALSLNSVELAIGQMKSVMVLLALGWLLTALGFRQAARASIPSSCESESDGTG